MAFPLINPYQQFFDANGDPLVSGTIEFRAPADNSLIDSYPTADDADAQTNANSNPLTLSSTGAATNGLFLEDGVNYKVILKDSDGATVGTWDDVQCPTDVTQATVGAALYRTTTPETFASVTVVDKSYAPGHIYRYDATSGSNYKVAIQASINQYSHGGARTFIPKGNHPVSGTIYGYYDASNNTGFKSDDRSQGHIYLYGEGRIEVNHFNNSEYYGSVINFSSGRLDIHDGHTTAARGSVLRDLSVINNDASNATIRSYYNPSGTQWVNLFVANADGGGQFDLRDIFNAELIDIMAYGNAAGTGIKYDAVQTGGGNVLLVNVTSRNNSVGWDLGSAYDASRSSFIKNWTFLNCQASTNTINWRVRHGIGQATWINCWNEGASGATGRGFAFSDMAGWEDASSANPGQLVITGGGNFSDSATDSGFIHIEIGDDTGTETTDGVGPIVIQDVTLGQIGNNTIGIRVHNSTNASTRDFRNINAHNNGGVFCALDDEVQVGPVSWENLNSSEYGFANHVTDTAGSSDLRGRLAFYKDSNIAIHPISESYSEKTITGGVAAVTALTHSIDTQADASTDDLDSLTGGIAGQTLVIRAADSARTVVCKDGTGNLLLAGDFSLDNVEDRLFLHYDGTNWHEISRSDNGA